MPRGPRGGQGQTMQGDPDEPRLSRTRHAILAHLLERPRTVCELAREVGIAKSAAHRHVTRLVDAGLLTRRACGRKWVYYDPTEDALAHVAREGVES